MTENYTVVRNNPAVFDKEAKNSMSHVGNTLRIVSKGEGQEAVILVSFQTSFGQASYSLPASDWMRAFNEIVNPAVIEQAPPEDQRLPTHEPVALEDEPAKPSKSPRFKR